MLLIFLTLVVLYATIMRAPIFKLNIEEKDEIKQKGLIHFTNCYAADSILREGLRGSISKMGIERYLGDLVWTYEYATKMQIEKRRYRLLKTKKGRDNPQNFEVCLRLRGFSDSEIEKFRIRKGLIKFGPYGDRAIAYRGKLLSPKEIEIIHKW